MSKSASKKQSVSIQPDVKEALLDLQRAVDKLIEEYKSACEEFRETEFNVEDEDVVKAVREAQRALLPLVGDDWLTYYENKVKEALERMMLAAADVTMPQTEVAKRRGVYLEFCAHLQKIQQQTNLVKAARRGHNPESEAKG